MPERYEGWEGNWKARFALLVEEGICTKLGWEQIPWRWRHLHSDVYVNRVNQYQLPPQEDVIQSCRKNAVSWLRCLLSYCGNIYILTNSNQKPEYCSTVGSAWSGSSNLSQCEGILSQCNLGVGSRSRSPWCFADSHHSLSCATGGFPRLCGGHGGTEQVSEAELGTWVSLPSAQRPRRVQDNKPEGGMGTRTGARSKGWEDQRCRNSTALLQGIKSGGVPGGPDGWFYGSILLSPWFWMGQHCIWKPLLPQAEHGVEMVLMITF